MLNTNTPPKKAPTAAATNKEHVIQDFKEDKQSKKVLMEQIIREKALAKTQYAGLIALGYGIRAGDLLHAQVLLGSQTNYAYKVALANDPSKAVFVMVCI
ncbi:hypothetical protein ACA910_018831 [Epithemia clementina (nom. ined.)]